MVQHLLSSTEQQRLIIANDKRHKRGPAHRRDSRRGPKAAQLGGRNDGGGGGGGGDGVGGGGGGGGGSDGVGSARYLRASVKNGYVLSSTTSHLPGMVGLTHSCTEGGVLHAPRAESYMHRGRSLETLVLSTLHRTLNPTLTLP